MTKSNFYNNLYKAFEQIISQNPEMGNENIEVFFEADHHLRGVSKSFEKEEKYKLVLILDETRFIEPVAELYQEHKGDWEQVLTRTISPLFKGWTAGKNSE